MGFKKSLAVIASAVAFWVPGFAQTQPTDDTSLPLTIIIPFATGGSTDALVRIIADHMQLTLKRPVVVQNIGGAGSTIGLSKLARSKPDGLTIGVGTTAGMVINPLIKPKTVTYRPTVDLVPITRFTESNQVLVAHRDKFPANTIPELIDYLKAHTGKVTFGTPGIGTNQQLAMEQLQVMTGTTMVHVPYTASNQVLTDLIGGQIDLAVDAVPQLLPQIQTGKLKVLGYTGAERPAFDRSIPTIGESVKGYRMIGWHGFFAPAGTPAGVVERYSTVIREFMARPETIAKFESLGTVGVSTTSQQLKTFLAADIERIRPIVIKAKMVEQ